METSEQQNFEIIDGKVMLKPMFNMEARQIGEVMDDEQKTVEYFQEKFGVFAAKVDNLEEQINTTENKGSFLMKVVHLKNQLKELNGIGDFEGLDNRLEQIELNLKKAIEENRHKNLGFKQVLLTELEAITSAMDFTPETFSQVKEIQQKWIRIGKITEELEEEYENRFDTSVKEFFSKRQEFLEAKKLLTEARIEKYKEIVAEAKALLEAKNFENKAEPFKQLQKRWKEVGHVSPKLLNELWDEFKTTGDAYFSAFKKDSRKNRDGNHKSKDGLKRKKELVKKSKELYEIELSAAMELAKDLQKDWKNSGFAKKEDQQPLYEEFMLACDFVFEYRFLNSIFDKKTKNGEGLSDEDRIAGKVRLMKNLIHKDNEEISRFEDNSFAANVVIRGDSSFGRVVDSRSAGQKRKLEAKKMILAQLHEGIEKR